jgi:hypothetical protein
MVFGALTLVGPVTAMAAPPAPPDGDAGPRVNLTCDASVLGADVAPRIEHDIAEQLGPVLEQANMLVVAAPENAEQTLSVRVTAFDEEQRNYDIDLELRSDGGVATMVLVECPVCTERRLIAKLAEEIPRLIEVHQEKLGKDGNAITPELRPQEELAEVDQPVAEVRKRRLGPLGITGAAMLGVGVAALATGGYLLDRGVEVEGGVVVEEVSSIPTVDYLPPGVATLAAGFVAAGVGATLLALDLARTRKGRVRRFALQMTPTYVGIQIHQRF